MTYGLLFGVVVTYLFMYYVQPHLDIWMEVYRTKKAIYLEKEKLRLEVIKCKVVRRYPEINSSQGDTVVQGFQYNDMEECYNDEINVDEEDEQIEDRTIGYKLNR